MSVDFDLLGCPRCHGPLRAAGEVLKCADPGCGASFQRLQGIPSFLPPKLAARFVEAQAAERQHHENAWTHLDVGCLPWITSLAEYREWLQSFYSVGFYAFGFPVSFFAERTVLEVGSGPYGMLAAVPHRAGVAVDPLMPSFAPYMRDHWQSSPVRVAALGETLPVRSGVFDAAVAINCLDHTLEPEAILCEMHRAMKSDGLLFIMNNVKSRLGVYIAGFGECLGIKRLTEVYHPHALTQAKLAQACTDAGFHLMGCCRMKISDPEVLAVKFSWKGRLRRRLEDEHALWLLARKVG